VRAERDELPALTLADVLQRLGPNLITVAAVTGAVMQRSVSGVVIYDRLRKLDRGDGHVLLAVGVDPAASDAVDVVGVAARCGFAAVVLHAPPGLGLQLSEAARELGIALLVTPSDVPWVHLAAMLRVGMGAGHSQELDGVALGDLFGFASALAIHIGGAVTVEDPQSRVMAYSSVDDDVDEPRKETILGRQVPRKYMRLLQEKGVLRQLTSGDDVVHMAAVPEVGLRRRLAISVRAAGEMLGSIRVAESGRLLTESCEEVLREAAKTAALHMVRHRIDLHHDATLRHDLVRDLLDGGGPADVVAIRLGIEPDHPYTVLAFETVAGNGSRERLLQVIDLYCSASRRTAPIVDVGPRVYVVLPDAAHGGEDGVRRFATEGGSGEPRTRSAAEWSAPSEKGLSLSTSCRRHARKPTAPCVCCWARTPATTLRNSTTSVRTRISSSCLTCSANGPTCRRAGWNR
jgi:hypothetical protein